MKSDTCAATVARILANTEFVAEAVADFESGVAEVKLRQAEVDLHELVSCLRQAGYDVESDTVVLSIEGMSCVGCAANVQWALEDAVGVIQAVVDLATEEARVSMLAGLGSLGNLHTAVEDAGYQIRFDETADLKATT